MSECLWPRLLFFFFFFFFLFFFLPPLSIASSSFSYFSTPILLPPLLALFAVFFFVLLHAQKGLALEKKKRFYRRAGQRNDVETGLEVVRSKESRFSPTCTARSRKRGIRFVEYLSRAFISSIASARGLVFFSFLFFFIFRIDIIFSDVGYSKYMYAFMRVAVKREVSCLLSTTIRNKKKKKRGKKELRSRLTRDFL